MQKYVDLKDKGNQLFKQQKFEESIGSFQSAIDLILQAHPREQISQATQVGKLYVILSINAAFAALNLKTRPFYQKAETYCSHALQVDPKNQKGLFRRALANKELAQLLEVESKGSPTELLELYGKAKKDFEEVIILDKSNDLAQKKLSEVIKNIYRVNVSQGNEASLLSSQTHKTQSSGTSSFVSSSEQPRPKREGDMNRILKQYRIEEVASIAREKVGNQYLSQQLPRTRAELEKAMREIEKSEGVLLKFIYRMDQDYLKKIQPTFDMLFQLSNALLKGEGEATKEALLMIRNQKAFDLLWKSFSGGQKKQFREKWVSVGLVEELLK